MVHVFSYLEDTGDDLPPMCDMTFAIVAKAYDEHSSSWRLSFQADATPYEPVGFDAVIPVVGWREQIDSSGNDDFQSYWGYVTLYSRGAESDRLLALMADYYNIFQQASAKASFLQKIFGYREMVPL